MCIRGPEEKRCRKNWKGYQTAAPTHTYRLKGVTQIKENNWEKANERQTEEIKV